MTSLVVGYRHGRPPAFYKGIQVKVKITWIYIVPVVKPLQLRHGSHSLTCKQHYACLYLVSIHQMELPLNGYGVRLIAAYYSSIDPERMKG